MNIIIWFYIKSFDSKPYLLFLSCATGEQRIVRFQNPVLYSIWFYPGANDLINVQWNSNQITYYHYGDPYKQFNFVNWNYLYTVIL